MSSRWHNVQRGISFHDGVRQIDIGPLIVDVKGLPTSGSALLAGGIIFEDYGAVLQFEGAIGHDMGFSGWAWGISVPKGAATIVTLAAVDDAFYYGERAIHIGDTLEYAVRTAEKSAVDIRTALQRPTDRVAARKPAAAAVAYSYPCPD